MARNEIIISSNENGSRVKTSAVKTATKVAQKTSILNGNNSNGSSLKAISKGMRTVRTGDLGAFGLFGGSQKGAIGLIVQEGIKFVSKGIEIAVDINLAKTGENVRASNIKNTLSYLKNPFKFAVEATYGEWLRDLSVSRQNVKNEYYRNLTGNLVYGKQYGNKN